MKMLWNTTTKELETQYGGKFFIFKPDERKMIDNENNQDLFLHLLFKLEEKGLVELEMNPTNDQLKRAQIKGLKARHKLVDGILRNYRTMNKEREAMKLSAEAPSDHVYECALEAKAIQDKLGQLEEDKVKALNDYFMNEDKVKAEEAIQASIPTVEVKENQSVEIKRGSGQPPQRQPQPAAKAKVDTNAIPSAKNS